MTHRKLALVLTLAALATPAISCEPQRLDRAGNDELAWIIPVREGADADTACDEAIGNIVQAAERRQGLAVMISGYAAGGAALSLARIALFANRLRGTLLQRFGKLRLPVEESLLVDPAATADAGLAGHVVLRLYRRVGP